MKHALLALMSLLLLALEVRAEGAGPEPGLFEPPVVGRVVDPEGRPVSGVVIWGGGRPGEVRQPVATTSSDGTFEFPRTNLLPDQLEACRTGWIGTTFTYRGSVPGYPVTVRMRPAGRIAGRVVDESGAPVAGARIDTTFAGWGPGCVIFHSCEGHPRIRDGWSDDDGYFAFESMEPGWFKLQVGASGFLPVPALRHKVEAGGGGDDLEIVLSRGLILEGSVRDADGNPIEGAGLSREAWGSSDSVQTDAEGRFRMSGIPPGRHQIIAAHPERGWIEQEVELDRNRSLDLRMPPTTLVRGLVMAHDGGVVAKAGLSIGDTSFEAGADGRFQIAVPPGEHEIKVYDRLRTLRKRVRAEGRPVDLEIRFPRPGKISGRLSGLPPGESCAVFAKNEHGEQKTWNQDERDGTYRIEDLHPGEWTVTADDLGGQTLERRIHLEEGAEATVDFRFAPLPRVRGRVLDPEGNPVGNLGVTFVGDGHTIERWAGPDGSFEAHLREGTWEVWAERAGFGPSPRTSFTVAAEPSAGSSDTTVEIPPVRLTRPVTVYGRVLGLQPGEVVGWVSVRGGSRAQGAGTDQENQFQMWDLGPGLWTFEASLENRTALSTVQIAPDQKTAQVELTFVEGEEALTGQVLGNNGEWILVVAERIEEPGLEVSVDVPADGRFKIPSLLPGHYRVRLQHRPQNRMRTLTEVMVEVPGKLVVIDLSDFTPSSRGQR